MNVLSLFDGNSCGQIALNKLGIKDYTYYASEIDKYPISVTQYNYPNTIQLGDVTKWKDWSIDFSTIDLLIGGSPCFVAGTKVITSGGYKPIESIAVGDYVLTHKNRLKKVLRTGSKVSETFVVKAQGIKPTETTENHPYYVREMTRVFDNKTKQNRRTFSEPKWKKAVDLKKGDFLGIPINTESKNPLDLTKGECFILGRYIADGHTRKDYRISEGRPNDRMYGLILSIGDSKVDGFTSQVKENHFSIYKHTNSVFRAVFSNKRLVLIAEEHCGCGAENKKFSQMLLNLPVDLLGEVLRGYVSGDESERNGEIRASSVSEELIMGLSLVVAKVYNVNSSYEFTKRNPTHIIEGRVVNQKDTYTTTFRTEMKKQSVAHVIDGIVWVMFRESYSTDTKKEVFNLEVETDNSYTANNAIVHNCQGFSVSGKGLNFDDPRSKLFFVFVDILNHIKKLNPNLKFLLENVKMKGEWRDVISSYVGVEPTLINSALVSAQNRQRYYWTSLETISQPEDKGILLKDIVEQEGTGAIKSYGEYKRKSDKSQCLDANYWKGVDNHGQRTVIYNRNDGEVRETAIEVTTYTERRTEEAKRIRREYRKEHGKDFSPRRGKELVPRTDGKANCLTANLSNKEHIVSIKKVGIATDIRGHDLLKRVYTTKGKSPTLSAHTGGNQEPKIATSEKQYRKLTPLECERLQTVPDNYTAFGIMNGKKVKTSNTRRYMMLGNGWTVDVITHIFRELIPGFLI